MTIHSFSVKNIQNEKVDLSQFKGKKLLIVNLASECSLTSQYEQLEELYSATNRDQFEIIGFPANNFGAQEPGTNEEILNFCTTNFGTSFHVMSKISVKGDDQHELYQFLTQKEKNGVEDVEMIWNFQKFLIDEEGSFVKSVHPNTLPIDDEIQEWINS
ncbi:MAG: glutathione peroxidase [Flavobacteriales bacterium]|nr:glutathione peroxidase [Flavobacteriales bacterium]